MGKGPEFGQKIMYTGNNIKSLHLSVEQSLKRLRTDYIDLLYVHWWDYATSVEEIMDGLHNLVAQGKVLYLVSSIVVQCRGELTTDYRASRILLPTSSPRRIPTPSSMAKLPLSSTRVVGVCWIVILNEIFCRCAVVMVLQSPLGMSFLRARFVRMRKRSAAGRQVKEVRVPSVAEFLDMDADACFDV